MKYLHIHILIAFMSIFNTSCENPSKEAKIKMVLTGSVHGQLDPCGWKKNPLGGLSRKFIAIEDMRKAGDDPLILDAGDKFFSKTNININNINSEKFRITKFAKWSTRCLWIYSLLFCSRTKVLFC